MATPTFDSVKDIEVQADEVLTEAQLEVSDEEIKGVAGGVKSNNREGNVSLGALNSWGGITRKNRCAVGARGLLFRNAEAFYFLRKRSWPDKTTSNIWQRRPHLAGLLLDTKLLEKL